MKNLLKIIGVISLYLLIGTFFYYIYLDTYILSRDPSAGLSSVILFVVGYFPFLLLTGAVMGTISLSVKSRKVLVFTHVLATSFIALVTLFPIANYKTNEWKADKMISSVNTVEECINVEADYKNKCILAAIKKTNGKDACNFAAPLLSHQGGDCEDYWAYKTGNTNYCPNTINNNLDIECVVNTALINNDIDICSQLNSGMSQCTSLLDAVQNLNPSNCTDRYLCKLLISVKAKDLNLCVNTVNYNARPFCEKAIQSPPEWMKIK